MKTLFAVLILLPFSSECASAATGAFDSSTFDAANKAYVEKNYAEAITGYQSLLDDGTASAPLLFNLGNAYAKTGDVGRAVASYLRAQILAPNDAAVAHNLEAVGGARRVSWFDRAAHLLSMNAWSWLGSGALTLLALALAAGLVRGRSKWIASVASGAGLALALSLAGVALWYPFLSSAVVIEQTTARVSPFDSAETAFAVTPGMLVQTHETHGDFTRVTDDGGREAWLSTQALTRLMGRSCSSKACGLSNRS